MPSLATLLRALGNERAVANATAALAVQHREEWIVTGLLRRLDRHEGTSQPGRQGDDSVAGSVAV